MKPKPLFLLAVLIIAAPLYSQEQGLTAITAEESSKDIRYLSSDALEGRRTGSEGNKEAAAYISAAALEMGIKPLPGHDNLFQPLDYLKVSTIPGQSRIIITDSTGNILQSCDITPLITPSDSIDLKGEVAFAGYGYLNSKEKYNDFAGVSFKDKIVIVMTRNPDLHGSGMPAKGEGLDGMIEARKLPFIIMQQAKAVLFVADPALGSDLAGGMISFGSSYQLIPLFRRQFVSFDINAFAISIQTADLLLGRAGLTLKHMQDSIATERHPASFIIPDLNAEVIVNVRKDTVVSSNIIGYIEGSDPKLKDECIMYTAHYDHVGMDEAGNVYNGANDNASGSVGLLNVARAFTSLDKKPLRSIVFLWTTGEEEGLHGSSYYVDHPFFPVEKTVAEINFDMIGRSRRETDTVASISGKVDITGRDTIKLISSGKNPDLVAIAEDASAKSGIVALDEGQGIHFSGSDHYPFYRKGIPVLFFFTGLHSDYHRPTDDFEFIDLDKLVKVSKTGFLTGYSLANIHGKPLKIKRDK
jgi:hypothetical protein